MMSVSTVPLDETAGCANSIGLALVPAFMPNSSASAALTAAGNGFGSGANERTSATGAGFQATGVTTASLRTLEATALDVTAKLTGVCCPLTSVGVNTSATTHATARRELAMMFSDGKGYGLRMSRHL
jgi:hypothetical protein